MFNKTKNKGITLIALIVTIIILLILAGVSIQMLSGNNGILSRAVDAKQGTEEAQIIEQANMDILAKMAASKSGDLNETELGTILSKYGTVSSTGKASIIQETLTSTDGNYQIPVSKIYNGLLKGDDSTTFLASEIFEENGTTTGKMHVGDYINYPVYYDNVASSVSRQGTHNRSSYPSDSYNGWRVLSVEGTGNNKYIKLISAGIPLNYYHSANSSSTSIQNLTINIFSTAINSNYVADSFYDCGFKASKNGTQLSNMSDVMNLFNNTYTAKYATGENAIYNDEHYGGTYTNSNAENIPKVRTFGIYEDATHLFNTEDYPGGLIRTDNLLVVPSNNNSYCNMWLPEASGYGGLFYINGYTGKYDGDDDPVDWCYGIRCVVLLTPSVKYSLAEGSSESDEVKVWNIQ